MSRSITVLLVDDHAVVRTGYRLLLSQSQKIGRVTEVQTGEQACRHYHDQRPDVVVMDLSMPGIGGLDAIRRICAKDSAANILVFSIHDELVYVNRALQAGARGYITKRSAPDILVDAVLQLAAGSTYIEPLLNEHMHRQYGLTRPASPLDSLSAREFDVFILLAKGLTVKQISDELRLGYKTVANYNTSIKGKLNANTGAELARLAYEKGLV